VRPDNRFVPQCEKQIGAVMEDDITAFEMARGLLLLLALVFTIGFAVGRLTVGI